MNRFFGTLFFVFAALYAQAQMDPLGTYNRYIAENWKGTYYRIGNYKVKGTPFFFGEAFTASTQYKDGRKASSEKILYNLYDQLAGREAGGQVQLSESPLLIFSMLLPEKYGSKELLFKHGSLYDGNSKDYFNVLAEGSKACFLKVYRVRLVGDPSQMMDKDLKIFEQYAEYYLYKPGMGKAPEKVKLRKKEIAGFLETIPGAAALMEENDIDFSSESAVRLLIGTLNDQ